MRLRRKLLAALLFGCAATIAPAISARMGQPSQSASLAARPATPIYPVAAQFADSLENTPQIIGGITAIRVNTWGRLFVNVPSGTTAVTAWLANSQPSAAGFDLSVGVYLDGAWSTGLNATGGNGLQAYTMNLDGAAHVLQFWNGYETFLQGTYIYAVQGTGISIGTAPAVTRRLVFYGDSILVGGASTPPGQKSFFALVRAIYPGGVSEEAFGGRQLWDDSGSGSGQLGFASASLLAARLVGLQFGVSGEHDYWIEIGINDVGAGHWSASTFGTNYAALLDAIHAADSTGHVWAQSMFITTTSEGTAPAWRTQIQTACTARPSFCVFVDGPSLMTTAGLSGDGLHPTNTGHQAIALGTGAAAGTISIKAVLGI